RKNRALTATALGLVLALIAGTAVTGALLVSTRRSRDALAARDREQVILRARAELEVDPTRAVQTLATLPRGADRDDLLRIAIDRGVARAVLEGHSSEVRAVAFAPGGRALVTVGYDRTVRSWDVGAGTGRVVAARSDAPTLCAIVAGGALFVGGPAG